MCWAYLLHDVGHAVVKVLLCEDGRAVIVLILSCVILDKELFEGHGALLLIGDHQLVAEAEQNELKRKQCTRLKVLFPGTEAVLFCAAGDQVLNPLLTPHLYCVHFKLQKKVKKGKEVPSQITEEHYQPAPLTWAWSTHVLKVRGVRSFPRRENKDLRFG